MEQELRAALEATYKAQRLMQDIAGYLAVVDTDNSTLHIIDKVDTIWNQLVKISGEIELLNTGKKVTDITKLPDFTFKNDRHQTW